VACSAGSSSTCDDNPSTIRSGGRRPLRRCRASSAGGARISPAPPASRYGSRRRVMLWWRQKFSDGRRRQGGSRIRTRGPPCQRNCSLGEGECVKDANAHVAKALSVSGDRGFESYSLQRGVVCEPEDDIDIPVPRGSTITRCIAIVALARKLLIVGTWSRSSSSGSTGEQQCGAPDASSGDGMIITKPG
jgi:hypothetical protein